MKKILIVEKDLITAMMIESHLGKQSFETEVQAKVEGFFSESGNLAVLSGHEDLNIDSAVKYLVERKGLEVKNIILLQTSLTQKKQAMDLGIEHILEKPFELNKLMLMVNKVIAN